MTFIFNEKTSYSTQMLSFYYFLFWNIRTWSFMILADQTSHIRTWVWVIRPVDARLTQNCPTRNIDRLNCPTHNCEIMYDPFTIALQCIQTKHSTTNYNYCPNNGTSHTHNIYIYIHIYTIHDHYWHLL